MVKFDIFKQALDDEYLGDQYWCKRKMPLLKFIVARPLKLDYLYKKAQLLNYILPLIMLIWIVLFPFYFLCQCIKFFYKLCFCKKNIVQINENDMILMGLSNRAIPLMNKIDDAHKPSIVFTVPWCDMDGKAIGELGLKALSICDLLSCLDTIKALFDAIILSYRYIINSKSLDKSLQIYIAFRFMLVYLCLSKIYKNKAALISVNQFDRWAVLFGKFPDIKKRIYVQHGNTWGRPPPGGLINVDIFYYFDVRSKNFLLHNVFANQSQITCLPIKHHLQLQIMPYLPANKKNILMICSGTDAERESQIIENLLDSHDVNIIIKPHPLFKPVGYDNIIHRVFLISDKNFYPKVGLAISSGSSLGVEYEAMGIPVIWIGQFSTQDAIKKIMKFL